MRISSVSEPSSTGLISGYSIGKLGTRRGLTFAAAALSAAALWFGWHWLVVAGAAPLLMALAPCLLMCGAMCGLKLCMTPKQNQPAASLGQSAGPPDAAAAPRPSRSCAACD